jgi:hypothetical protein
MICPKCKYEWECKSKHRFVSCPSCMSKVKVNKGNALTVDMDKRTKIRFVYQKKVLKERKVCGLEKGEADEICRDLSKIHNVPLGEINIEFD